MVATSIPDMGFLWFELRGGTGGAFARFGNPTIRDTGAMCPDGV